jgi:hypothetical protein
MEAQNVPGMRAHGAETAVGADASCTDGAGEFDFTPGILHGEEFRFGERDAEHHAAVIG